ncbi:tryptophan ABC transporter substrate-binding protein [Streptococcus macacae]|uniref:ABC transporter substrate binding protein n=1 Tax=Streptococcus macacae NCTC 11558 TaxID=764298 RepID=G5JVM5_9STRE|nr:tryptophan ABC transporter substrate-binding protein [Streptococcus macacae]EHJ52729.1 ABC transporter substrate binding protein [Streptococcus macacae NCTC 11558]SUN78693.1 ABC transporter substrate-binding protein [Streptococcus macacae NCTC 11558]
MKNKRLLASLLALAALIVILLAYQAYDQSKQKNSNANTFKLGVLQYVSHEALDEIYRGVKDGLKKEGYSGKKVKIEFLNAEGDQSKVQTMSQTLVNHNNDLLIGIATPSAQGLASATKSIPVVMGAVTDPVGAKLVKNLKKPDGNVTGVSDKTPIAAQAKLMKTLTPNVKTVGVLYSSSEDNSKSQVEEFKQKAKEKGLKVSEYAVPSTNEISTTMNVLLEKSDAVWLPLDNTIASAFPTVVSAAKKAKKPIYPSVDTMVDQGGLASVVVNQYELGLATGKMAAKIHKGQKVTDTPVYIFDKGKPIINKKVAKTLDINIPAEVLKSSAK